MKPFLKYVAEDLYRKIGNNLANTIIIFPNKRANLFFNEHLAELAQEQPIWAPACLSISELLNQISPLRLGDPIGLVCELYQIFKSETKSKETLDEFYFWGELLISDFDDLDKNLVDANKIFNNLNDLKELSADYDYLDEKQKEVLNQFFDHCDLDHKTELKERFVQLWGKLNIIYHKYQEELRRQNIAYEGMLYRDAIERLDSDKLKYDTYVFVGFNVLNRVEHQFFSALKNANKALFYWDYDHYYTNNTFKMEAGEFINRNLLDFPNELPSDIFEAMKGNKNIQYVASPTENAQARFLPQWIGSHCTEEGKEKENAVVLCNESLLLSTLHSIPETVKHVNITMGFPLTQTPIYSFIKAIVNLQTQGYDNNKKCFKHKWVLPVLKHPYTKMLSKKAELLEKHIIKNNLFFPKEKDLQIDEFLSKIFTPLTEEVKVICNYINTLIKEIAIIYRSKENYDEIFNQLYREAIFKCYTTINRFISLNEENKLDVKMNTLSFLFDKVLSTLKIPFHGEPAIGLQVMGVLETRNLDFKNLIMLSVNEGQLPKATNNASFIPYNLRKAFGMTTIEHKNAVYAYYFYRLIQRAENITLMYNTSSDGMNKGEWSRFLLQLLIENKHPISLKKLEGGQQPENSQEIVIPKSEYVIKKLNEKYNAKFNSDGSKISPSALNKYIDCSLSFYFRWIAGLNNPDELSSEIDPAIFGNIFHEAAEKIYTPFLKEKRVVTASDLKEILNDDIKLRELVNNAFKEKFFNIKPDEKAEYNGIQLINFETILTYIKLLLKNDIEYTPFTIKGLEEKVGCQLDLDEKTSVKIGGFIDRMDLKGDTLRVVDYKTGGKVKPFKSIEELFEGSNNKRSNYAFQTFVYSSILINNRIDYRVAPSLFYVNQASLKKETFDPIVTMNKDRIEDFAPHKKEFEENLKELLAEIFNPEIPFKQTELREKCEYCDFKAICRR